MTILTSSPSFTLVTSRLVESDGTTWLPANSAAWLESVPTVSGVDQVLGYGEAVPASALFTLSDPDGSPTLQYQFWDSPGGGSLRVAGLVQPAGQVFSVAAADLAGTEYVAHSTSWVETLWVRAYDGLGWSAWASLSARTNASPVCAAADRNIDLGQWRGLSEWVSVSDPDGDPPSAFEVRDLGAGADSGRLWGNGVVLAQGGTLSVASLAEAWVCGALTPGTDTYEVRARDLYGWGEWVPFTLTTRAVANRAPEVSLCEAGVRVGLPLALADKVEVSDADGDAPVAYGFWEGSGGGYLRVGGLAQASGQVVTVPAARLADTVYVGGAAAGAESLYLRAYDGQAWGPWASASLYSYARATNSAPAVLPGDRNADPGQWRSLAELVAVEDADGDPALRFQARDLDLAADGARLWQGTVAPQGATLTVGSLGEVCLGGRATPGADHFAVRAFDGMDWGEWQAFTLTTRAFANHAPVASASDAGVRPNQSVALSGLVTVTDADADAPVSYGFWDTPGGGYLRVAGAAQPAGRVVVLSQAQFAGAEYVGGATAGSETVFVQAYDGQAWSPWASWRMDVLNQAPQTTSAGGSVPWGHVVAASTLFSASDPDVDPIAQYQFWESPGGGQLRLGGTALPEGQVVSVAAAELAALQYVAGQQAAVDTLWVRASDGYAWSGWATGPITTVGSAPQVQASYIKVGSGLATPVSSLFTVTDPDADAMTLYRFWDSPGGGYFALDGQAQPTGTTLTVTAANLSRLTYVGAEDYGPDLVYAAAHDGTGWGPWASWTVDSVLRFAEWEGTAGNDFPILQGQPSEQIYFGLQGDDGFSAPYEVYPFLMGGQGDDYYGTYYNGMAGLVTVFENGASPNDVLSIDILLDELGAATIAGRHLALTDEAGDRMIVLIDWQQPANRIEIFWVAEGEGEDFYTYQVSYEEMVEAVREADVQEIAWGDVGYSDAYVDEALTHYSAREAKLAGNRGPAVTTTDRVVGHAGNSIPLSDLFSASDPDGDIVVRYELFLGYNSPQPGHLRVSGVARHEQLVTIEAAQLPAAEYVSDYVGDISHALRVRAYDGLDWGGESTVYVTTTVNHSPTAETTLTWVEAGHSVLLAPLISTRDFDGDAIVQYELSVQSGDTVRGTVYLHGQPQSLAEPLLITADDLNALAYETGPQVSGPDWFLVSASDGTAWAGAYLGIGTEVAGNLNRAPIVAYVSQTVVAMPGSGVPLSQWLSSSDPNGGTILKYRVYDSLDSPFSGYYTVNGAVQTGTFEVWASDLADTRYFAGTVGETLQVDAFDGSVWGSSGSASIIPSALRPPTVAASDRSFAPGTVVTASALFSVSNPDAVAIHQYMFLDSGGGSGSGHFEYRDITRGAGIVFPMSAGELADLVYVTGATGTIDNLAVWTFSQLADFPYSWVSSGAAQFSVTAGSLPPDGAGDSLESARTLTVGSAPQTYRDCVGDTDTEDYYRFTLDGRANVIMGLTDLSGNADLQLLNADAAVQAVSSYPGNKSEMLSIDADAGTYYARVVSIGGADTQYALTLAAA